ncbi:MAG: DUF456 domain-containing protein [Candidatus Taylorbacteria bacterium]|nr:DUF456 domain-containing protein [Candidatus Taylorbacteria bacterium]
MEIAFYTIFSLLLSLGLVMVFVPFFPAMLYMFVITLIFAAISDFKLITPVNLAVFAVLVLINVVVDWMAGLIGARWGGASKRALGFGLIGLVAGFLLLPPIGGIFGLFAGVLLAEITAGKNAKAALKAASGGAVGALAGIAINFILALSFLIIFIVFLIY